MASAPRILLLGAQGQVGREAQRALAVMGQVRCVSRADCDLAEPQGVRALVREAAPDIIVNAAAWTAVDAAEHDEARAMRINAILPRVLAEEASRIDAWLVHYSSDYVFDGVQAQPYDEADTPRPLNAYGRSKLAGEQAVARLAPRHLILRTSWVFGAHGENFLKTILRQARERETLAVVDDQFGAPTGAALVADATAHALAALRRGAGVPGLYHLASDGSTSWCGYARHIVAEAARLGAELRCTPQAVRAVASTARPSAAARPANSRLDTGRFREAFGLALPPWQPQVTRVLQTLLDARAGHEARSQS